MKVMHVVTRMNVGGVAALVVNLARGLPEHGVEVVLATGQVQDGEVEATDLPEGTLRVRGLGRSPRAGDDVRALLGLHALVNRVRPDVVHTHTAQAGVLGRMATEGTGLPRVHTYHGHLLQGYFSPGITRAVTLAERALATRTDLLISRGQLVGDHLRAAGVGRRTRWLNIPPGVIPPQPTGRAEPGTVAFVGRLVRVKRLDRLIDAARLLPEVHFLVAGDGPMRAELQAGAPRNVEFLGWVQDVGAVYGRAELVVLCSDNEAMPLALIEGAMCGLPGVTTHVGSASEVVQDGRTGLVCGSAPDELAAAIQEMLRDPERRTAAGRAAKKAAEECFSVSAMCAAHAVAYRSLLRLDG